MNCFIVELLSCHHKPATRPGQRLDYTNDAQCKYESALSILVSVKLVSFIYYRMTNHNSAQGASQTVRHTTFFVRDSWFKQGKEPFNRGTKLGEKNPCEDQQKRGLSPSTVIVPFRAASPSSQWLTSVLTTVQHDLSLWPVITLMSPCIIGKDWNAALLMLIVICPCGMCMLTQKCPLLVKGSAVWPSWENGPVMHSNSEPACSHLHPIEALHFCLVFVAE